jgi:hypothetical protein
MTDTTLIERAKAVLEIVGDDTWELMPQETYDGRSTTRYYRVMDQNLNAICCEEYGAHCDGGAKKMHLIAIAPDLARAFIREREAAEGLAEAAQATIDDDCDVSLVDALAAYREAPKESDE